MSVIERHARDASFFLHSIMQDGERITANRIEAARILLDLYKHLSDRLEDRSVNEEIDWWAMSGGAKADE